MAKYRKKPIVIEAMKLTRNFASNVIEWLKNENAAYSDYNLGEFAEDSCYILIVTLEGVMEAQEGDYIIKGIKGEFYPCKPDIFEASYEKVEE